MQYLSIKQNSYNNFLTSGIFFFFPLFKSKRAVKHLEAGIAQQFHRSQCRQLGSPSLQRQTDPMSCLSLPSRGWEWLSPLQGTEDALAVSGQCAVGDTTSALQKGTGPSRNLGPLHCYTPSCTCPQECSLKSCQHLQKALPKTLFFYLPTVDWKLRFPTCQALAQQKAIAWRKEISELGRFLAWAAWKVKLDTQNELFLS